MVAAGVLKNPEPEGILGNMCSDACRGRGDTRRVYMASADEIHLAVKGKEAMQPCRTSAGTPCWRRPTGRGRPAPWPGCAPGQPSVLSFGFMEAQAVASAQRSPVKGTFRAMDEGWRHQTSRRWPR